MKLLWFSLTFEKNYLLNTYYIPGNELDACSTKISELQLQSCASAEHTDIQQIHFCKCGCKRCQNIILFEGVGESWWRLRSGDNIWASSRCMNSKSKNKKKKQMPMYAVHLYTDKEWVLVSFIFEMKKYGSGTLWCGLAHTLLSSVVSVKSEQMKFLNKGMVHCL